MAKTPPKLRLAFAGNGFRDGAVPLTILAAKLQSLQQAMFHAAASAASHKGARKGLWSNRYRSVAELTFASAHHSDLVIEAELAVDPMLGQEFDIGEQAVDILFDVAVAISNNRLESVRLQRYDLDYLLRSFEGLMPNVGDQYEIRLENCRPDKHPAVTFTAETRQSLKVFSIVDQPLDYEEVTIVGDLIAIKINAGEDKITVRSQKRDIDCYYGDALRDQIANLVGGSIVEVTGLATLNEREEVAKIHQVASVSPVSMEPLRLARFEDDGQIYYLSSPISINIEYSDNYWIYHHPGLNLWGYSQRREDALKELHANFAYLYHEIALEEEDKLDEVAKQLQKRLLALVISPSEGNSHAQAS